MAPKGYGKKIRVGRVGVERVGQRKWLMRYFDPVSGRDVRKIIGGIKEGEVLAIAGEKNREILVAKGIIPETMRPAVSVTPHLPVDEALSRCIGASPARPASKRSYQSLARQFVRFIDSEFPGISAWKDVTPSVIVAFLQHHQGRTKSTSYLKALFSVVRMTSRYWAGEHPDLYRDVAKVAGRRLNLGPLERGDAAIERKILGPLGIIRLLEIVRTKSLPLWGIATLQAFAGLDVQEAAWIDETDFDHDAGTLRVRSNAFHGVKNPYRARTIPILPACMEALRLCASDAGGPRSITPPYVFRTQRGRPFGANWLVQLWPRMLTEIRREGCADLPSEFTGRKLRASFITMCSRAGVPRNLIKRYIGHSQDDVMGRHYEAVTVDDLRQGLLEPLARYINENTSCDAGGIMADRP